MPETGFFGTHLRLFRRKASLFDLARSFEIWPFFYPFEGKFFHRLAKESELIFLSFEGRHKQTAERFFRCLFSNIIDKFYFLLLIGAYCILLRRRHSV
ncbi:MAG: hypothetical protein B7X84_05610 [Alphaproteobacteria bacterium 17-39-52]|nr:MAG: hypothetical protein B7X84_05610 [Alphaproteobacteria bacterium 17-39-52]